MTLFHFRFQSPRVKQKFTQFSPRNLSLILDSQNVSWEVSFSILTLGIRALAEVSKAQTRKPWENVCHIVIDDRPCYDRWGLGTLSCSTPS